VNEEYIEDIKQLTAQYGNRDYLSKALKTPDRLSKIISKAQKSNLYINGTTILTGLIFLFLGLKGFYGDNAVELRFFVIPGLFFFITFSHLFKQRLNSFKELKTIGKKYDLLT